MVIGKKRYDELETGEQQILTGKYGIQPKSGGGFSKYVIEYVRELIDDEKIFFQEKSFLSPHFVTQSLYKLKGNLQPIRFNRILKEKLAQFDALRTNYTLLNDKTVAVVFEERSDFPAVNFKSLATMDKEQINRALRTIMEADMREHFDINRGSLIRFSIYKTGADEYAVLVTMSHLIFPRVDLTGFFQEILGFSVAKTVEKEQTSAYKVNDPLVKSYWEKMLENLPSLPQIPYAKIGNFAKKQSKVYRKKLPEDLTSELLHIAKSNRMLLMAIIESAWSILLAEYNDSEDVFFSALLPDKKANVKVPNVRAMPVRVKINRNISVEQFVMNNFQQLIITKPYSSLQIDELHDIAGKGGNLFNHFLSFYDFMEEEKEYSDVEGTDSGALVLRNSWDSGPSHIGLYFQYEEGSVTLTLIYDSGFFANMSETLLLDRFFCVILQMLNDYNLSFSLFMARLKERIVLGETKTEKRENLDLYLKYELARTSIFSGVNGDDFAIALKKAEHKIFFEGDRISGDDLKENLVFLLKGRVARNVDTGDGWYRTLDILKEASLLNITYALKDPRLPLSLEILTDEAEVVFIKRDSMISLIRKNSKIGEKLLCYALNDMEKYQFLWMQS